MTWKQRADFATVVAWVTSLLIMAVSSYFFFGVEGHDFRTFYASGLALRDAQDPYDYATLAPYLERITGEVGNFPFYHMPWVGLFFIPFTFIPYEAARAVWLGLNTLAWVAAVIGLARVLHAKIYAWRTLWLFLLATYLFAWFTWRYEQMGILLLLGAVAAWGALERRRDVAAGVLLALLLSKPTISIVVVLAVLGWAGLARRFRVWLGFGVALIALLLVAFPQTLLYLQNFRDPAFQTSLFYVLDGPSTIVGVRVNTTLKDWLELWGVAEPLIYTAYTLAALVALPSLLWAVWRGSLRMVLSIAVLTTFWLVPYALQYDYPLLLIPIAVAVAQVGAVRQRWLTLICMGLCLAMLSVPFWEESIAEGFWLVIGATLLFGVAFLPRLQPRPALGATSNV